MRKLTLYEHARPEPLAVELVADLMARDPACERCKLNDGSQRSPCIAGEGEPGGLLLVGESPGRHEDAVGRPFVGASGRLLRPLVAKHWSGPVALDNAVRCAPGRTDVRPKMVDQCRPYLATTVMRDAQPSRIVCLGAKAAYAVTGRNVAPYGTRRGYTFMSGRVPVFFVLHPAAALRNRFVEQWFRDDLEWALTADPPEPGWGSGVYAVEDVADSRAAVAALRAAEWAAFDVETAGEMWRDMFSVISLAATPAGTDNTYVWSAEALEYCYEPLFEWLRDEGALKVGQNVKFDQMACLSAFDVGVRGVVKDTRLMRKLLEPEASAALDDMAELVGMGGLKAEALAEMRKEVGRVKRALKKENGARLHERLTLADEAAIRLGVPVERFSYKLMNAEQLMRYNARDSAATARLGTLFTGQLKAEPQLQRVWEQTVLPASHAMMHVERWGLAVDTATLRAFSNHLDTRIQAAQAALAKYPDVNWRSAPQVRELLYEQLKLPVLKRTALSNAPSTDAATLKLLSRKHPLPKALLEHRFLYKMKGTYADGMWDHIRGDGRIHPNVKLDGARSGRTSCTDPNLQNIPRAKDSPEGKMARDIFVASPGCKLIEIDYSQLELRVAAILSGDPLMRAIFEEGVDYHQRTAEMVARQAWNIEPEQVESKHRTQAKTINFALLYGMADKSLAAQLNITVAQAGRIREAILGKFSRLRAWCEEQLRNARRHGETWTWWDGQRYRRRPLHRVADADGESRSRAEHGTWNTPVQGTASDFLIMSLTECVRWIIGDGIEDDVKLVLPVHDSLMFDASEHMVGEVLETARTIMTSWPSDGVPLLVDAKVGDAWGSLEDYEWQEAA